MSLLDVGSSEWITNVVHTGAQPPLFGQDHIRIDPHRLAARLQRVFAIISDNFDQMCVDLVLRMSFIICEYRIINFVDFGDLCRASFAFAKYDIMARIFNIIICNCRNGFYKLSSFVVERVSAGRPRLIISTGIWMLEKVLSSKTSIGTGSMAMAKRARIRLIAPARGASSARLREQVRLRLPARQRLPRAAVGACLRLIKSSATEPMTPGGPARHG